METSPEYVPTIEDVKRDFAAEVLLKLMFRLHGSGCNEYGVRLLIEEELHNLYESDTL